MRIKERGGTHYPRLHFLLMGHCGTINRSGFVQNGLSGKWSGSLASTSTSLIERKHWPNEELGTHSIVFPRLLTCFVFISRLSRVQYLQPLHSSIPETRTRSWTHTHIHKYKHTHMRALFHNLFPQRENTGSYTSLRTLSRKYYSRVLKILLFVQRYGSLSETYPFLRPYQLN